MLLDPFVASQIELNGSQQTATGICFHAAPLRSPNPLRQFELWAERRGQQPREESRFNVSGESF